MICLTFIVTASVLSYSEAWIAPVNTAARSGKSKNGLSTTRHMLPEAAASVIAGSVAGAVGVGVAFPLDTLKTKQQIEQESFSRIEYILSPSGEVSIVAANHGNLWETVADTWKSQGLGGFYGGVSTSMMGQALIKATAFTVNTKVLCAGGDLVTAAATAGLVTAFLAVPVDRIKVLMQTDSFDTEYDCFQHVLDTEGFKGLLSTGLVPTLFREVPAYTLYFFLYGTLMASTLIGTEALGSIAPLVSGAVAGALCVVPVHPVDVVKTIVQHSATEWQEVVSDICEGQGFSGFWEGLSPRMSRAAVNHSVTFAVYDFLMHQLNAPL